MHTSEVMLQSYRLFPKNKAPQTIISPLRDYTFPVVVVSPQKVTNLVTNRLQQ